MRSQPSQRTRLARAWLLVLTLIAASSAHGCLLPELVVGTNPSSGGAPDDGTGAMGGDAGGGADGETSGGGSPADGGGGSDGSGGADDGTGGTEDGGGGDDSGGGGSGDGGTGSGGDGTGGAGTGGVSAGCGTATSLVSGASSIVVDADTREYVLYIPPTYTPSTAYSLVFAFHANGGDGPQIDGSGYFGLQALANETAVFVAPTGDTWANTDNHDVRLVEALLDRFTTNLCIDESRIFAVGFSAGGAMTNAIGCALGGTFRAIAPISGALYSGCIETVQNPIAMWTSHGDNDTVIQPQYGEEAVTEFRERNGCAPTSSTVDPSPCVAYEDCDAGYPVHYCSWSGDHAIPSFAAQGIWNFFTQL